MSHVHCHSHAIVGQVYKSVVNDTIAAVRSYFLDEGVDEQVLQELKQLWETKLTQSRAVDLDKPDAAPQPKGRPRTAQPPPVAGNTAGVTAVPQQQQQLVPIQITIPPQTPGGESKTIVVQVPVSAVQSGLAGQHLQTILSSAAAQATFALPPEIASSMLQQQLNDALRNSQQPQQPRQAVPAPSAGGGQYGAGVAPAPPRQMGQLDGRCDSPPPGGSTDGPLDGSTDLVPSSESSSSTEPTSDDSRLGVAATVHIPSPVDGSSSTSPGGATAAGPSCLGGAVPRCLSTEQRRRADRRLARRLGVPISQLDGLEDSSDSDDDDDVDDADDDIDDDDEDLIEEDEDQGQEEEPLNSEDDVSDHEPADLTETFNVMVCQYDKITRSRNKWKFHLKDGIMNLDGKDYIFQKAGGDAEW